MPSEAEWEKAERGTDGRIYPWGDEAPDANRCNYGLNVVATTPVGNSSPAGDSPYGCPDMAGNVREWCSTRWGTNNDQSDYVYPYDAADGREDPGGGQDMLRIARGASWATIVQPAQLWARCTYRYRFFPWDWYDGRGFRFTAPRPLSQS